MKKVVAAGHICIDITPKISGGDAGKIEELLKPGKLLNVGNADIHTGGAVANTGLAMKFLGADVCLAGKIGDDTFGDIVASVMERHHAADGLIRKKGESTSYSVVLAIPGIDRIFLHHPGANDTFTVEDLSDELLAGTTLFHFGYPPLMKRLYEKDGEELVRILRKAKTSGAAVSLDMAMVDPDSPAGRADWELILKKALPFTDIFVPSVEELMFMLERDRYFEILREANGRDFCEALNLEADIQPLAARCMELGVKILLIKCGAPGMFLQTAGSEALREIPDGLSLNPALWAGKTIFEKSYVPDRILSGTGAGDASIAAFLCAILDGETPEDALRLAAAEGASCVTEYDALSGLQPLPRLKEKTAAGWKKVEVF